VPVSRRVDHEHGATLGNRLSLIIVELPVDEPDPVHQLKRVHEQTSNLKGTGLVDGGETVLVLADQMAPFEAPPTRFLTSRIPTNIEHLGVERGHRTLPSSARGTARRWCRSGPGRPAASTGQSPIEPAGRSW
jgi:WS/DGAT C-terminal domain